MASLTSLAGKRQVAVAPRSFPPLSEAARYPLFVLLFAAVYTAAGALGLLFATVHHNVSPIWPATGVAIAVLSMAGARYWPGIAIGCLAVTLPTLPPGVCIAMATGSTLEGLAGAWLLKKLSRAVERLRDLPALAAAVIGPPVISASFGATSMAAAGLITWAGWPDVYTTWWRGDLLGALVVTPLLLEMRAGWIPAWSRSSAIEAGFLMAGLLTACVMVFTEPRLAGGGPLAYVVFPFLTWAAWRFGPRGATVATMLVAVTAIWGTALGRGPFTSGTWAEAIASLQLFLAVASVTALMFGAATADRRLAEAATAQSEARQAALLRALPDVMLRLGRDGIVLDCEASLEMPALPSPKGFVGRHVSAWLPQFAAEIERHLARALDSGALQTLAFSHPASRPAVRESGEDRTPWPSSTIGDSASARQHFEMRLVPSGANEALAIVRDVTERVTGEEERRRLERQFQESQKLESLGVLAGGIAHDFNNLLTTVLGNASLVRYELSADAPVQQYLEQIESSSSRAADLCRQLLAYAGKGRFIVERLDLSALVRDTTELLQLSISKSAVLKLELAAELPAAQADATQIRQVLMNLVMNASDAIGAREGTIRLRTRAMKYSRGRLPGLIVPSEPAEGGYVAVAVEDDGCGIPPELQPRLFEPFFTTKFPGRGLGLSAVLGIVRAHGGALHVESTVNKGSRFTLLLPAVAAQPKKPEARPVSLDDWRGSGTVLIVDDEANVRRVAAQMLESIGFRVLVAEHGAEGLSLFESHEAEIRAVLLDVVMPGIDGLAVLRELRARRPGIAVVLMSGFTEQVARVADVAPTPVFLQKPFGRDQLGVALRRILT